jgi:aromatic-L-amino-acid decarboxylase
MDYGPQLSRSFKAFKIWCSLQAFGVKAFVAAIDHTLNMTRYMQSQICADQAFELLAPVGLNAICFRLRNVSDEENRAALAQLVRDGTAILGPVRIDGRFGMRACIANYRTQESDIDLILRRLSYLRSSEFIGG